MVLLPVSGTSRPLLGVVTETKGTTFSGSLGDEDRTVGRRQLQILFGRRRRDDERLPQMSTRQYAREGWDLVPIQSGLCERSGNEGPFLNRCGAKDFVTLGNNLRLSFQVSDFCFKLSFHGLLII